MKKPIMFWDKITICYLFYGFLSCLTPGILLAVFVHWALVIIFGLLYFCGFPCLLFCSRRKAHPVLINTHLALCVFITSYNLYGYCVVQDGHYAN